MSKKTCFALSLAILLSSNFSLPIIAQTKPTNDQATTEKLKPSDYNVLIVSDERILITMAALTFAGYKYEGTGKLASLQAYLREDLKATPPELIKKLQDFYSAHRVAGREETAQISPYLGLALSLSAAPAFGNPSVKDNLPPDVRDVLGFGDLIREFYSRSQIRSVLPKYKAILDGLKNDYEANASAVLYETLLYLRTKPILELQPTPVYSKQYDTYVLDKPTEVSKDKKDKKDKENKEDKKDKKEQGEQKVKYIPRFRRLEIFPNPFVPPGAVFSRNDVLNGADNESKRLGDDYFIIASEQSIQQHIRHAFLRFVLDPIVGKKSVEIAELKEKIDPLVAALPNATYSAKRNIYEVVGESLARAVEVRLTARAAGNTLTNDDVTYMLGQYYEQGFVLTFHFYESLPSLERVGLDMSDFFPSTLGNIDFAREAKRMEDVKVARTKVDERRASTRAAVKPIIDVDNLIKQRKFTEAKTQLEEILREQPKNARALFGMAQIINNQPSSVEADNISADEDKIAAQEERLAHAVRVYREAIASANDDEKWLVSQCHVFIGKIYDFVEEREAAIREYDKAVELGDIPKGAYKEALEGKNKPYTPKTTPR